MHKVIKIWVLSVNLQTILTLKTDISPGENHKSCKTGGQAALLIEVSQMHGYKLPSDQELVYTVDGRDNWAVQGKPSGEQPTSTCLWNKSYYLTNYISENSRVGQVSYIFVSDGILYPLKQNLRESTCILEWLCCFDHG